MICTLYITRITQFVCMCFVPPRSLTYGGSLVGNLKDTQEMLNFCGEKNMVADVEVRLIGE